MSKTVTIQDATMADLKAALSAPSAPAPVIAPDATNLSANPYVLQDAAGTGLPNALISYDSGPTKATWLTIRCFQKGNTDGGFAGTFYSSQVMNNAGTWMDIVINGGLIDGMPGKEQINFDFVGPVDGKSANVSIVGRTQWGAPMLGTWPSELFALGASPNRWLELWLKEYPPRPGMPPGVTRCVNVNGGYVPIYE